MNLLKSCKFTTNFQKGCKVFSLEDSLELYGGIQKVRHP